MSRDAVLSRSVESRPRSISSTWEPVSGTTIVEHKHTGAAAAGAGNTTRTPSKDFNGFETPALVELLDSDIELRHWTGSGERLEAIVGAVDRDEVCYTMPSVELEPFASEHEGYMAIGGANADPVRIVRNVRRSAIPLQEANGAVDSRRKPSFNMKARDVDVRGIKH